MIPFSQQVRETIAKLSHCHDMCHAMAMTMCLETGGEHARPQHLRLMLDCADICALTADFLGRKSQFHTGAAILCADICDTCAEDCEKLGAMEDCVRACREAAEACRTAARMDHAEILAMASKLPPE